MTTLNDSLPCPLYRTDLKVAPCRPSKAGKNSLQVRCPVDARHFRGFIAHQPLVNELLQRLRDSSAPLPEEQEQPDDALPVSDPSEPSLTDGPFTTEI